ncbi:MAG: ABC transporter ATP-binding protein [Ignavibacteriales bacterium]|nr:ABC transporter ATP-binding protein [Ignavibacteriales bacterium]
MAQRLTIKDLSLQYSASEPRALSSLSLDVEAGSCCAIIGPTGAGKSTLLQCLAGTMRRHHPESLATGQIQFGETRFNGVPDHVLFPIAGLVLQDPYVQISGVRETVFDEVLFTLENLGTIPQDPRQTILSILQRLGIDHLADRKPTSLSGGETQRVALAAILIAQPSLLLLDEPTTALDSNAQDKLRFILRSLRGRTTVLLTDTQIDFALSPDSSNVRAFKLDVDPKTRLPATGSWLRKHSA